MKTLNNRTKLLVAIAALVVVVVVAGVVYFQVSGDNLFGTVISISISPSKTTTWAGQSVALSSGTSLSNCSWSSSNTSVASISSSSTKSATVLAKAVGTATITEKCGLMGRYTGSATVTVYGYPPPVISPCDSWITTGNPIKLSTADPATTWRLQGDACIKLSATSGASVTVSEDATSSCTTEAHTTVYASNPVGTGYTTVTAKLDTTTINTSPVNPTISVGGQVNLSSCDVAGYNCSSNAQWSIVCGTDVVSLTATGGQSVGVKGLKAGAATIQWHSASGAGGGRTSVRVQ